MKTRKRRTTKRADAKNSLPVGINYSHGYCHSGQVISRGRIRASCGRSNVKSFSILKYGEAKAISRAIDWRENQLARRR